MSTQTHQQDADKPKRIAGTWYALAQEEGKDSLESQLGVKPIVLYTTSMRAVRKTFDQCNTRTPRHPPLAWQSAISTAIASRGAQLRTEWCEWVCRGRCSTTQCAVSSRI